MPGPLSSTNSRAGDLAAMDRSNGAGALAVPASARHLRAARSRQELPPMNDVYTPPEVWDYDPANGGQFAGINRPTAGAREERELPVGEHPFQLYSLGTPNGVKATIMFEELLEAGFSGAEDRKSTRLNSSHSQISYAG